MEMTLPALLRACILTGAAFSASALAAPDTSVTNKQGFNTDVVYQIVTDRLVDGNTANNPTGTAFSAGCTQKKLYCGGDWKGIQARVRKTVDLIASRNPTWPMARLPTLPT